LFVDYLPRFALPIGSLAGFEARLRWNHQQMGLLLPEAFIAAADECGMLGLVSEWTLHEICRSLDGWRQTGLRLLPATLHIGSRQLREVDFLPLLERVLAHSPLTAEWLVLELREGVVTEAAGQTLDCIEQIDRLGLGLAVNDFGAGQSSLSRLQRLPLRCLTMSRELVAGVPTEPASCTLAAAFIALGHALGARVLADGVDQEAQRDFLADRGCDQMQGPLLSPALSRDQVASLLAASPKGG